MDDDELPVIKNSVPMLVPKELLEDSQVNLLGYLQNPHLHLRPVSVPVLTRRERFLDAWAVWRLLVAERLFVLISGRDPFDYYWRED